MSLVRALLILATCAAGLISALKFVEAGYSCAPGALTFLLQCKE